MKTLLTIWVLLVTAAFINEASAQEPTVVVPNVFTPNNDGNNDIFTVRVEGFTEIECLIFNRYGAQVYRFEGINGSWDGRTQAGMACGSGIYSYFIRASNSEGTSETYHGNLHLLRD